MSFGKNLQRLRKAAGWSQSALAAASGASVRSIQNWEIDRSLPRIEAAGKIARALGVTVDELMAAAKPARGEAPRRGPGRPPKAKPADPAPEATPAKKGRRKRGE